MKTLFLDTFSGISGDMMLGLLVNLGVDLSCIEAELQKLDLHGFQIEQRQEKRHGIGGSRIQVSCSGDHPQRSWSDIDALIAESGLNKKVQSSSRAIFRKLGEAEAHVHQTSLNDVHFHEVGAVDAIVDIVGSACGLEILGAEQIFCSPLPMSSGMIKGSHGIMPLPAPAVLQILAGQPVRNADCDKELVTPTGAAIAATLAQFTPMPEMTVERVGYGVGGWDLEDRPNLLRGILGRSTADDRFENDRVTVIETHIDDSPAEWLGSLLDRLISAGALDAGFTPLQMKKNRPGVRLTVIAKPQDATALAATVLRESSAIGVRMHEAKRMKLRREAASVETSLGEAAIKLLFEGEDLLRITPEHASCLQLADNSSRPLPEVYRLVSSAANRKYGLEE